MVNHAMMLLLLVFQVIPPASTARKQPPEPRRITIQESDGGSVVIVATASKIVMTGKGSSLRRKWLVLNDTTCPVQLSGVGLDAGFSSGFYFAPSGIAVSSASIRAAHINFNLFDLWGEPIKNLLFSTVTDIDAGSRVPLDDRWNVSAAAIEEFSTSVSFVGRVLLADGTIWTADLRAVSAKMAEAKLRSAPLGPPGQTKEQ
jgi:hypothetical protein